MPHKTKGSPEEKLILVEKFLTGELSAATAAKVAGVHSSTFESWIRLYKQEGSLGLLSTGKNRSYAPEVKRNAVEAYLSGEGSIWSVCEEFKIRSTKHEYCGSGEPPFRSSVSQRHGKIEPPSR